jgi:hypothetical protein
MGRGDSKGRVKIKMQRAKLQGKDQKGAVVSELLNGYWMLDKGWA